VNHWNRGNEFFLGKSFYCNTIFTFLTLDSFPQKFRFLPIIVLCCDAWRLLGPNGLLLIANCRCWTISQRFWYEWASEKCSCSSFYRKAYDNTNAAEICPAEDSAKICFSYTFTPIYTVNFLVLILCKFLVAPFSTRWIKTIGKSEIINYKLKFYLNTYITSPSLFVGNVLAL